MKSQVPHEINEYVDRLTFGIHRVSPNGARPLPKRFAFKRILVAVDGSKPSEYALEWGCEMARTFGARVWVAHAVLPASYYEDYAEWASGYRNPVLLQRAEERRAARLVADAAEVMRKHGVDAEATVLHGFPAPAILEHVDKNLIDLLIVGSHGRGTTGRLILGSFADAVKNHVACSVLIARRPPQRDRLLIAVDGSAASKRAAGVGLRLATSWNAHATILHVLHPPVVTDDSGGRRKLQAAASELGLPEADRHLRFVLEQGRPADRVARLAEEKAVGLIVMGSRGLSGLKSLVAGSVSNRVAHRAQTSVLLVKQFASETAHKGEKKV